MVFTPQMRSSIQPHVAFVLLLGLLAGPLFARVTGWWFPTFFQEWMLDHLLASLVTTLLAAGLAYLGFLGRLRRATWNGIINSPGLVYYGILFVLGVGLYTWCALEIYHGIPRLDDDACAVKQAEMFVAGHITMPASQGEFFEIFTAIGPWCSEHAGYPIDWFATIYPPTWSVLLMPGVLLDCTWLINPLLGGLLLIVIGALGTELFGRKVGRLAALLALASPFLLIINGTHLSHTSTACLMTGCIWAVLRLLRTSHSGYGLLAGLLFFAAFLDRPATAFFCGAVTGLMVLVRWKTALAAWKGVILAGILAVAALGVSNWYNAKITGTKGKAGHEIGLRNFGKYGLGKISNEVRHSPTKAVRQTIARTAALQEMVNGWPIGVIAIMLIPLILGRMNLWDAWLFLFPAVLLLFYMFFWYYEEFWPGRYIFSAIPMMIISASRGIMLLAERSQNDRRALKQFPTFLVVWGLLYAAAVAIPHQLSRYDAHYGDVEPLLPEYTASLTNAVVFVKKHSTLENGENDFYTVGWMCNDLALTNDVIYARDLGARNPELMQRYPGRKTYRYSYDVKTREARLWEFDVHAIESGDPETKDSEPEAGAATLP